MYWLVGLVVALACGCFGKPGFTERSDASSGDDDAAMDAPCARRWQPAVTIPELTGLVTGEPTITGDRRIMMWARQTQAAFEWEIRWADRASVTDAFGPYPTEPFASGGPVDPDPSITDDGLLVLFRSGTPSRLFQAIRPDRLTTWLAGPVAGGPDLDVTSLDISADGLTAYYTDGTDLYSVSRATRSAAFGTPGPRLAQNVRFPAISGDELTIYYTTGGGGVYSKQRTSKTAAFPNTAPTTVYTDGKDPDVTADGTTLVLGKDGTGAGMAAFACDL